MGPPRFLDASLHTCHCSNDPGRPSRTLPLTVLLCWFPTATRLSPSALISYRGCNKHSGSTVSPLAYMIPCVRFACIVRLAVQTDANLRHTRNTRYRWMANPYPMRTSTSQEASGLSWRTAACFPVNTMLVHLLLTSPP